MCPVKDFSIRKICSYLLKEFKKTNANKVVKVHQSLALIYAFTALQGYIYLFYQNSKNYPPEMVVMDNARNEGKDIEIIKAKGLSMKNDTTENYPSIKPSY